jgi:hypothetical protein
VGQLPPGAGNHSKETTLNQQKEKKISECRQCKTDYELRMKGLG